MIADEGLAWLATGWFAALAIVATVGALRARNALERASYIAHVVMLAAMALMPWSWFMVVPELWWIGLFGAIAAGYAVLALRRPGLAVAPGAGRRARPITAWYHVVMMLGMVWMVVLMGQLHGAAEPGPGLAVVEFSAPHAHGTESPRAIGQAEVPPLWNLPLWMTGLTILLAGVFVVAAVRFLAKLRLAPPRTRPGAALPARAELVMSAAIAIGMAAALLVMP